MNGNGRSIAAWVSVAIIGSGALIGIGVNLHRVAAVEARVSEIANVPTRTAVLEAKLDEVLRRLDRIERRLP